jgi:hypothetical protein
MQRHQPPSSGHQQHVTDRVPGPLVDLHDRQRILVDQHLPVRSQLEQQDLNQQVNREE